MTELILNAEYSKLVLINYAEYNYTFRDSLLYCFFKASLFILDYRKQKGGSDFTFYNRDIVQMHSLWNVFLISASVRVNLEKLVRLRLNTKTVLRNQKNICAQQNSLYRINKTATISATMDRTLRVAIPMVPPLAFNCSNYHRCPEPGFAVEITRLICRTAGLDRKSVV